MKSYLLKSISILLVVIAFGCSQNETIVQEEEESLNQKELIKAKNTALDNARGRAMHTILAICPQANGSSTFTPLCDFDLDSSITVYHSMQSPNCNDVFMVWVDSLEYYAFFEVETNGTRHVFLPPYGDEPSSVPVENYEHCFD